MGHIHARDNGAIEIRISGEPYGTIKRILRRRDGGWVATIDNDTIEIHFDDEKNTLFAEVFVLPTDIDCEGYE